MPCRQARELLGKNYIIGISCQNNLHLAKNASLDGADYVALGSVYKTRTKKRVSRISIPRLNDICEQIHLPVVAIGGINIHNISEIKSSMASMAAISSALFESKDLKKISTFLVKHIQ